MLEYALEKENKEYKFFTDKSQMAHQSLIIFILFCYMGQ